ncbi:unnamed protein product [Arctogadus glacialis]
MEGLKESLGMKITAQGLTTPPPPLIFPEKIYKSTADVIKVLQFRSADKWSHTISTASSWFNKVDLSFRRLNGRPDVRQLGVMVQRPNAALNYTSVSYSHKP